MTVPSAADLAATVQHALSLMGGIGHIARDQAEEALDALLSRCQEAEARVRELEADPDRPTVVYAGDELEAAERSLGEVTAAYEATREALRAIERTAQPPAVVIARAALGDAADT